MNSTPQNTDGDWDLTEQTVPREPSNQAVEAIDCTRVFGLPIRPGLD